MVGAPLKGYPDLIQDKLWLKSKWAKISQWILSLRPRQSLSISNLQNLLIISLALSRTFGPLPQI